MLVVLAMAGTLWGIGAAMGTPKRARWIMVGILFAGVMLIQFTLPFGHPLREATGSSPALWLLIAAFAVVIALYRRGLMWIRARTNPVRYDPPVVPAGRFTDVELERYARHIVLREVGGPGQKVLKDAKVLVVGAGGLGSPALLYLASSGVGTIGIIDGDVVENSNLQRQVIHMDARIGMPKVFSAEAAMKAQNPYVAVRPYHRRLTQKIAAELIAEYDLVLDGTDNFETRYLVNETCCTAGVPLIAAALTQWEGQISVYHPKAGTPCYACIFPNAPDPSLAPSCAEAGVIGPLPGVVGAMMAVEAIKEITGAGTSLRNELLLYDALHGETRKITLSRTKDCAVCGG
jgi:molybdopterin/thiamine biosynthesis adenylyltransferase